MSIVPHLQNPFRPSTTKAKKKTNWRSLFCHAWLVSLS